jgi:copper homeostasis protein
MLLEIAVFNYSSALLAANAGADRLELCDNYFEGGTTASYGVLKKVREKISIPVFPIIRPRGSNFFYTDDEFNIIKKDIQLCKELGYDGIVTGILTDEGNIDTARLSTLIELAYPMEVTFHRAFDRCKNPLQALQEIIQCSCQRILTSGQMPTAIEGKELISALIQQADERIIIMPGSGVRSNNIIELKNETNATEFHSSAKKINTSSIEFEETISVDVEEIKSMLSLLKN